MAGNHKCPYCGGRKTRWRGYRVRTDGVVRLKMCKDCNRKFTTNVMVKK